MNISPVVFLTNLGGAHSGYTFIIIICGRKQTFKLTRKPATERLFTFPNVTNNGYEFLNIKVGLVFSVEQHPGDVRDL